MVALGQQRTHRERRRGQVVRVLGAALLDQLGHLGGREHVVLPQRGGEERGQHGAARAVAHEVVVERPLVLRALAAGERALEEPQAVDGERAALTQQRVPFVRVERSGAGVVLERQCRPAVPGDLRVAPLGCLAAALERGRDVLGQRADERADIVERVVHGQCHAHAGVLHRHGREHRQVRVEAVVEQRAGDVLRDCREAERDVADRRDVVRREREAELLGQLGEQHHALAQRRLAPRQLVGQMDPRRLDRGAQERRLDRAREDHRTARGPDPAAELGIGEHERPAGGGERLVQRRGDDQPRVHAERLERRAAPVRAGPANAVRVVDVEVQVLVAVEQPGELGERRQVGEHRVDAVGQVPDPVVAGGEPHDQLLEALDVVVADQLDRRPLDAQLVGRHVHARMDLVVEDHRVAGADQHGQRRQVTKRRRGRDEHVAAEHLAQQRLELGVLRRGQVRARAGELGAVAGHGGDHGVAHARVEFETQIAAGAEVQPRAAVEGDSAPVDRAVIRAEVDEPVVTGLRQHLVKDRQSLFSRRHGRSPKVVRLGSHSAFRSKA